MLTFYFVSAGTRWGMGLHFFDNVVVSILGVHAFMPGGVGRPCDPEPAGGAVGCSNTTPAGGTAVPHNAVGYRGWRLRHFLSLWFLSFTSVMYLLKGKGGKFSKGGKDKGGEYKGGAGKAGNEKGGEGMVEGGDAWAESS